MKKPTIESMVAAALTPQIITPHALPMFRDGEEGRSTKRKREKERMDPRKSKRPELPITGPGKGGRVGASATQHVVQNIFRDTTRDLDVRFYLFYFRFILFYFYSFYFCGMGASERIQRGGETSGVGQRNVFRIECSGCDVVFVAISVTEICRGFDGTRVTFFFTFFLVSFSHATIRRLTGLFCFFFRFF